MRCLAVIDTNVLVSALLTSRDDAATVQVVSRMISGDITPLYSGMILSEYRQVLNRKKFGFDSEAIQYLLRFIEKRGMFVEPSSTGVTLPDIKDLPFYEVVMDERSKGAWLVTGNLKHFPREPYIVTPRQLLDILDNP